MLNQCWTVPHCYTCPHIYYDTHATQNNNKRELLTELYLRRYEDAAPLLETIFYIREKLVGGTSYICT